MNTDVVVALIGLTGVGLGAVLSGIAYFLKVRSERMKTKNNVLYHLLEIRHLIKSQYLDPDELSAKYLSYCEDYFFRKGLNVDSGVPSELKNLIDSHFQGIAEAIKPSMDSSFIKSLNDAVSKLAADNPALAFQLSGKERVNNLLEAQSKYLEGFNKMIFQDETSKLIKEAISSHAARLNYDVIEDLIKDIDTDISLVSKKSGLLTYVSIRRILQDTRKVEVNIDQKEIDPIMDKLLAVIVDAANKPSQRDGPIA